MTEDFFLFVATNYSQAFTTATATTVETDYPSVVTVYTTVT